MKPRSKRALATILQTQELRGKENDGPIEVLKDQYVSGEITLADFEEQLEYHV